MALATHHIDMNVYWGGPSSREEMLNGQRPRQAGVNLPVTPEPPCEMFDCQSKADCRANEKMCKAYVCYSKDQDGGTPAKRAERRAAATDPANRENPTHELWLLEMGR